VVELFQARGITVNRSLERPRIRQGGEEMEIDLLLVNGDTLVVVEVKTTLRVGDVRAVLEDLKKFPNFSPNTGATAYSGRSLPWLLMTLRLSPWAVRADPGARGVGHPAQ